MSLILALFPKPRLSLSDFVSKICVAAFGITCPIFQMFYTEQTETVYILPEPGDGFPYGIEITSNRQLLPAA